MVFIAFLMAESSSLLIAPLRNWSGWCFTTRLFSGLGVGGETGVGVGVSSGVGSGVAVVDARSKFGLDVGVAATAVAGFDFTCCASKTVFSRTYIEIRISMIEAPLMSFRISGQFARFREHSIPLPWLPPTKGLRYSHLRSLEPSRTPASGGDVLPGLNDHWLHRESSSTIRRISQRGSIRRI